MRSERGYGEGFVAFMLAMWIFWVFCIVMIFITANQYPSEKKCLEEWVKCDRVSETWEPVEGADHND